MGPAADNTAGLGPLAALVENPSGAAVLTDFDGTLAPIVDDPETAVALPGAAEVLAELSRSLAVVAVVSGRPVLYLAAHLEAAGPLVRLFGGYGVEWMEGGQVHLAPDLGGWSDQLEELLEEVRRLSPAGLGIEPKGWAVTLHWRQHPETGPWAAAFAEGWERRGLHLQHGRMAVEIRPPVDIDKGTVVEELTRECRAACFFGDDVGDLQAFAALDRLSAGGVTTVKVAVVDEQSPAALVSAADVVVHGPRQALDLLRSMAARLR